MKDNTPKRLHFGPFFPNFAPYGPHLAPYWGCLGHPLGPFFVAPMFDFYQAANSSFGIWKSQNS